MIMMTQFENIAALLGIGGGVAGVVAWLVLHLSGVIKVLEGGNISVQTVAADVKKYDPALYAEVVADLAKAKTWIAGEAARTEAAVQAKAAAELQKIVNSLQSVPVAPAVVVVPPPVDPGTGPTNAVAPAAS